MKHIWKILLLFLSLVVFIVLRSQEHKEEAQYRLLFDKAEAIFNGYSDEHKDSLALTYYKAVIRNVALSAANANLLYNCYERAGILQQGLAFTTKEILNNFYKALLIQQQYHLADSISFRLLLSIGNVHYTDGVFDSSLFYFSKAENIITQHPGAGLPGDLYNSLGALYSETGDYRQSSVYFNKALEITRKTRPDLREAIFAMSLNIASALKLSGYRDTALLLYKKLLDVKDPSLPVLSNIAGIYLQKRMPDSALIYLNMIRRPAGNFAISFNNSLAEAWMQKNDFVQAQSFLTKADSFYQRLFAGNRNASYGMTNKLRADISRQQGRLAEALRYYQLSVIQADYKFSDTNVLANPGNFTGDFASYGLFESLLAKAACFAALYAENPAMENFNAAVSTYDTAFALADYIKKSIDNDEARLFIADKVFHGYQDAVDFILRGKNVSVNDAYFLKALQWISKSMATSLTISLNESNIKQFAGLPDSLLQKEKNLKVNISRLKLYLQEATDSTAVTGIVSEINSRELELHRVQNDYRNYPVYYAQKFAADNFDVKRLQQQIPDDHTAVVVYFTANKTLLSFVIKRTDVFSVRQVADSSLSGAIAAFTGELSSFGSAGSPDFSQASSLLYSKLIRPLEPALQEVTSLIIIPNEQLISLPFEALQMPDEKYLTEQYAVTYQYALPFLHAGKAGADFNHAVAFAPFAATSRGGTMGLPALHFSAAEINSFARAQQFFDSAATRKNFLQAASSAAVIHLATHAVADFQHPSASFIAFYPSNAADSSYKIYAHELYNLQLPATRLVFLSACETGTGKLSQSEGALSLARAFSYAGCSNIVTSLWKAEDRSTAYLSDRFYNYMRKGYTYASALQHAKIDLLKDPSMSQFRSPQYWSHLVFIGDMQEQPDSVLQIVLIIAVVLVVLVLVAVLYRKYKAKP